MAVRVRRKKKGALSIVYQVDPDPLGPEGRGQGLGREEWVRRCCLGLPLQGQGRHRNERGNLRRGTDTVNSTWGAEVRQAGDIQVSGLQADSGQRVPKEAALELQGWSCMQGESGEEPSCNRDRGRSGAQRDSMGSHIKGTGGKKRQGRRPRNQEQLSAESPRSVLLGQRV